MPTLSTTMYLRSLVFFLKQLNHLYNSKLPMINRIDLCGVATSEEFLLVGKDSHQQIYMGN